MKEKIKVIATYFLCVVFAVEFLTLCFGVTLAIYDFTGHHEMVTNATNNIYKTLGISR
jgi:hypothetical protein